MLKIIKELYNTNRCLLGEGYDNALEYLKHLLKLDIIEIPSGTKVGTWTVPDEWIVRDAWVKKNGKKVISYKKEPLSLVVGSMPFNGTVSVKEFKKHLYIPDIDKIEVSDCPTCTVEKKKSQTPYEFFYYKKDWGFCIPTDQVKKFKKGKFEVFIDTEFKKGTMKIGVHTIKGKSKKEILLFAHLDHPFQANDNLSGVATLVDTAFKLKANHTIKIIFCPETIGSIAYALTQDISNVEYVIALDCVGNDNDVLIQRTFTRETPLDKASYLAVKALGLDHRMAEFRFLIGSDEYIFNDPKIGVPGIMISRWDYPEYHSSEDKPSIIKEERLKEIQDLVIKTIELLERDYVPELKFKGPLMRSSVGAQTFDKRFNRGLDYFIYLIDGKKSLLDLCLDSGLGFDYAYELLEKMYEKNLCSHNSKGEK